MDYIFPKENLKTVTDHLDSLDIETVSLQLNGNLYRITTVQSVPEEQLDHLGMVEA